MRLVHWSHKIVTEVKGEHQGKKGSMGMKPNGFWLSDESRGVHGWRAWCKAEGFRSYGFRYEHEVELAEDAKILYLRNAKEIDDFADEYIADTEMNKRMGEIGGSVYDIDWKRVAKKYQGIIITPYVWQQRLGNHMWYYSWDCASGVIWNKRAIKSIEMVKERKVPKVPTAWQRKRKHKRDMVKLRELSESLQKQMQEKKYG